MRHLEAECSKLHRLRLQNRSTLVISTSTIADCGHPAILGAIVYPNNSRMDRFVLIIAFRHPIPRMILCVVDFEMDRACTEVLLCFDCLY